MATVWSTKGPGLAAAGCGDGAQQMGTDVERMVETERPDTVSSDHAGRRRGSKLSRGAARRVPVPRGGKRRRFPGATRGGGGTVLTPVAVASTVEAARFGDAFRPNVVLPHAVEAFADEMGRHGLRQLRRRAPAPTATALYRVEAIRVRQARGAHRVGHRGDGMTGPRANLARRLAVASGSHEAGGVSGPPTVTRAPAAAASIEHGLPLSLRRR